MDLGLKGKVALIAGASQGMGKAAALGFARDLRPRRSGIEGNGGTNSQADQRRGVGDRRGHEQGGGYQEIRR